MDLKGFDHDGRRWMEGDFEGRFFALDEHGQRLMLETPTYGYRCFEGDTNASADVFTGTCVGVVKTGADAFQWLHGDPTVEPWRIHRETESAAHVTVPLGGDDAGQAE